MTNNERQKKFRATKAEKGQKEMRGIFVTDQEEIKVKPKIREILKKMR